MLSIRDHTAEHLSCDCECPADPNIGWCILFTAADEGHHARVSLYLTGLSIFFMSHCCYFDLIYRYLEMASSSPTDL